MKIFADIRLWLLLLIGAVFTWSAIGPYERHTWWMEVAPVLIALPLLLATHKKFPLTTLLYVLIAAHMIILMVGGHYTYARVPFFDVEGMRNNYDKLGHFAQGFIPAIIIRELLLRTSPLRAGKWMFALIVFSCLGISAIYEIIEWFAGASMGEGAQEFLGTQGDEWDTQKDMAWCGVGAIAALALLSRLHDRALKNLGV
jgi:putative membrane protein